jgi:hypothetical protein
MDCRAIQVDAQVKGAKNARKWNLFNRLVWHTSTKILAFMKKAALLGRPVALRCG